MPLTIMKKRMGRLAKPQAVWTLATDLDIAVIFFFDKTSMS